MLTIAPALPLIVRITSSAAAFGAVRVTKCALGAPDTLKAKVVSLEASALSVSPAKEMTTSYSPVSSFPRFIPVQSKNSFFCQSPPALRYFISRGTSLTSPVMPILGLLPVTWRISVMRNPPETVAFRSMRTSCSAVNSLCPGEPTKESISRPLTVNSV